MSQKVRINGAKEDRDSQAVFKCVECGYKANADVNAAMNILGRALNETGGDTASDVEEPQWRSHEASTPSTQAGSSVGVRSVKGIPGFSRGEDVKKRNEPTKEQVEAAAGFLRDNLHLFGPQACFLETGHIDEIAYGMLRAAGKAAH